MLRIVSTVSRPTSTGLLGKVVTSTHTPHSSTWLSLCVHEHALYPSVGRRSFASTSARGADITLTVDGKEVTVPQGKLATLVFGDGPDVRMAGSALIQACEAAGATIPRFVVFSLELNFAHVLVQVLLS